MAKKKKKKAKARKKVRKATRRKTTKKTRAKARPRARSTKKKKKGKKRKPSAAFMKAMTPSAALAAIVGSKALPRTQVTKKLWIYIKKHKLQDKIKRTFINADEALKKVFGGKGKVDMFQMTKLVNRHLK